MHVSITIIIIIYYHCKQVVFIMCTLMLGILDLNILLGKTIKFLVRARMCIICNNN